MAAGDSRSFTHSYVLDADDVLYFKCATDLEQWPWLALSPNDPIVAQNLNYYAAYETAIARKSYERGQWTALTSTFWTCGDPGAGHAVRGVAVAPDKGESAGYEVCFFDRNDRLVYRMGGEGVVFRNRDFEAWRREQKQALGSGCDPHDFLFTDAASVGMGSQVECYLAPLGTEQDKSCSALVTRQTGFPPLHPYHDGSGDHVNASHLADVGRQFVRLLQGAPDLVICSGEMRFRRYVELDHMISLQLSPEHSTAQSAEILVRQFDHLCATLRLCWPEPSMTVQQPG